MMSLVCEHGRPSTPCSVNFSMPVQTDFFSAVISLFLKHMIIFKSFNSESAKNSTLRCHASSCKCSTASKCS